MPEYLAPGVFVEEVSYRSKSIEGVSTTTTGFIGPCAYGPVETKLEPEIVTSLEEFERTYGPGDRLNFKDADGNDAPMHNYLWHAVRAFFAEGGRRLYIARVFLARPDDTNEGYAQFYFPGPQPPTPTDASVAQKVRVRARFPGTAGNMRVRFTLRFSGNVLGRERIPQPPLVGSPVESPPEPEYRVTIGALTEHDIVFIRSDSDLFDLESPVGVELASPLTSGGFYRARREIDLDTKQDRWYFERGEGQIDQQSLSGARGIYPVQLAVTVIPNNADALPCTWPAALDPAHRRGGSDSLETVFNKDQTISPFSIPISIKLGDELLTGLDLLDALFDSDDDLQEHLISTLAGPIPELDRSYEIMLDGGNDGIRPEAGEYEGKVDLQDNKTGLKIFEDVEDISIVAAPGSTFGYETADYGDDAQAIINHLIIHASKMRYRIAVIDSGNDQTISQVRELRGKLNSKYAALYYPWVRILDPITRAQINLPPSGFVAGIYARNDTLRAVYKAPANEVVNLALGFERSINKAQQEVLNPEGVNCFRFFEGRGYLLWGARMATDDPEWKYVNLRRYFAYLERSIDVGTQWAVFEPNGPDLWANITRTIEDFLFNEWSNGALLGDKPAKSYFVRCDRSTMTQNDLDNGRMVCLIGVAPLRPAEFVIFRIGQWTGDARR